MVMALDTPVTDQPVSRAIGCRNTGSENMPPIATQLIKPPAATITQRYEELVILALQCVFPSVRRTGWAGTDRLTDVPYYFFGAPSANTTSVPGAQQRAPRHSRWAEYAILFRPTACFSCGFPSRPTRSKTLHGAQRHGGDRLKRQRSASGYHPLNNVKCQIGPKVPHDPCVLLHRGTAGQQWAENRNRKAPSVAGGAWKISVRGIQRTRNLIGSPAQGGPTKSSQAHMMLAVRLKPRITMLLETKTERPLAGLRPFLREPH